jgi:O-antigen ligase
VTITVTKPLLLFAALSGLFIAAAGIAVFTDEYFLIAIPFFILLFYAAWQNRNFVFFLLLAALPFSFEYNFSSGLGTDIPDELLMLLVSAIFLAYWLYKPSTLSKKNVQHPLLLLYGAVLFWVTVTVIFSTHLQVSVKYLLAKTWYAGAIATAATVMVLSMLLVTIIALIRHYQSGFSFATINDAVSPFFRNHVNYSAMLVCILPVVVGLFQLSNRKEVKLLWSVAIIIFLVALFFSYARGAWLALLAGAIAYWLLKKKLLFYSFIASIIITIAGLFWLKKNDRYLQYAHDYTTTIFHKDFSEHLISTYQLKDVSTAERFYRWIAGVRMIKDNWLTGYGPNTFYENYKGYTVPAYKTWVSDNPEHSTVHNYFLLTVIEQGIPGFIFLLLLFGSMIYYTQYLYQRLNNKFYKTATAAIGVMLVMIIVLNFLSDLIETDKVGSLFFLCLSMLVVVDTNTRKESDLSPHIKGVP